MRLDGSAAGQESQGETTEKNCERVHDGSKAEIAGSGKSPGAASPHFRLRFLAPSARIVTMRRRTFRQLRAKTESQFHHHVYVVLLNAAAAKDRKIAAANPQRDPNKPCVYVGMTGLQPEERFWNHKNGEKAARIVQRFGVRLLTEMFAHLNPMPFEAAAQMEKELAEDLRAQGYTVAGGT